jgi:uncharacterized phage protein (TIGR01671 family)
MREFKFKVWDKKNKIMWTHDKPTGPGTYWHVGAENYVDVTDNNVCRDSEDFILLQFTGLKTRDGIEVWEGDVITCRDGTFEIQYEESFAKFIMVNGEDRILSADNFFIRGQEADTCMRSIEVIGNIYENPELNDVLKGETAQ